MKKLKKSILGAVLVSLSLGLVGCSSTGKDISQLEQIKEKGVLTIGTSADYPPYEFHKEINGKDTIVGFEMDIAKSIADDLGVELEIKDMKFDGLLGALKAGNIDMVISGMTPTEERKKAVSFTDVYYEGEHTVLIKKEDKDKYKTIEDLKDASLAVQKASIQEGIAKDIIGATDIKSLGKITDVVLELETNKVDAIVISKDVIQGHLKQYQSLMDTNMDLGVESEGSAIGINKSDDMSLVDAVNESIDKLEAGNKIEEFIQKATELMQ